MTSLPWLNPLLAFLGMVATGYFTYRASTRAAKTTATAAVQVKNVEVDAAAYERARQLYESGIAQLEEQIARLRTEVNEERGTSGRLRDRVEDLEATVAWLRTQLMRAGIDVAAAHLPGNPARRLGGDVIEKA